MPKLEGKHLNNHSVTAVEMALGNLQSFGAYQRACWYALFYFMQMNFSTNSICVDFFAKFTL